MKRLFLGVMFLVLVLLASCGTSSDDPLAAGDRNYTIYCAGCHSRDPQGNAVVGPTLAMIQARAAASADPAAWLREGIIAPNAEIAPGYQEGLMPPTYGQSLSPSEIDALVQYMLQAP